MNTHNPYKLYMQPKKYIYIYNNVIISTVTFIMNNIFP